MTGVIGCRSPLPSIEQPVTPTEGGTRQGDRMKAANPYLNFKGNTREAFEFYRSGFGGEFQTVLRRSA